MEIDSGTPYSSVQYNRGRVKAPFTCYIESKLPEKILSLRILAVESWEDDFQNPFLTRKGTKIDINYLFYAMVL